MKEETKTHLMQTDELPHVCLCFPEFNCIITVSKCVGVGRRKEKKTMHFFALQLSNRYANALQLCIYEQNVCRDSGQQAQRLGGGW